MSLVWTPQQSPPASQSVSSLSPDGEVVWQALLHRHQRRQQARQQRHQPIDPRNYYQTLYQRCFGTPQSVRNLDLTSPMSSQTMRNLDLTSPMSSQTVRNLDLTSPMSSQTVRNLDLTSPMSSALVSRRHTLPETPTIGPPTPESYSHQVEAPVTLVMDSQNSSNLGGVMGLGHRNSGHDPSIFASTSMQNWFDHEQQFLSPLHKDHEAMIPFPKLFTPHPDNKKAPATVSRLSELRNQPTDTQQNGFSVPGPSALDPVEKSGHSNFNQQEPVGCFVLEHDILGSQSDSQQSVDANLEESHSIDPSQSLFTQPDVPSVDQDTSTQSQILAASQTELSPSPPLDLSPDNETFHLLRLQSQHCPAEPCDTGIEGYTDHTTPQATDGISGAIPPNAKPAESPASTGNAEPQLSENSFHDVANSAQLEQSEFIIPTATSTCTSTDSLCDEQQGSGAKEQHQGAADEAKQAAFEASPEIITRDQKENEKTPHPCSGPTEMTAMSEKPIVICSDHGTFSQGGEIHSGYANRGKEHLGDEHGCLEETLDTSSADEEQTTKNGNMPVSSVTKRLQELQNKWLPVVNSTSNVSTRCVSSPKKRHQQTIEAVLRIGKDGTAVAQAKRPKKTSFSTPFKSTTSSLGTTVENTASPPSERVSSRSQLSKVWQMSDGHRQQFVEHLALAEEVALTLTYDDGSSQLRELPASKKKKSSSSSAKVTGLAVAYPRATPGGSTALHYAAFPLGSKTPTGHCKEWCRQTIGELMASKTRKLCFDGQELIQALLDTFHYEHAVVSCKWQVIDPRIAGWLLNPDNPPEIFKHLLMPHLDLKQAEHPDQEDQVCSDLGLLGPVMLRLYDQLSSQHLWELYSDVEMKLAPILAVMEKRGICIDRQAMAESCTLLKKRLKKLESLAHQSAGHPFVLNSHAQLRQVLFEELRLDLKLPLNAKKIARTSVNQEKSTSESVLTQLQDLHPLPQTVLHYRQLQKLKSTYVDGMMAYVRDGQLWTHWDQTAAATGRLTSTNPNIQAIPKQAVTLSALGNSSTNPTGRGVIDAESVDIYARAPFTSRQGHSLLAADFQQIELRLLAHFSKDQALLDVFSDSNCQDIFVELTSQWLNKATDEVTQSEREQTKRVVYSVMYGAGKDRLAEYLKIPSEEAKGIMLSFLVTFPGVNSYTKTCVDQAKAMGYQSTLLQRRRWFPYINHPNNQLRAQAERQAVNFCIQGSAADLCKVAMIQVEHALAGHPDLQARLLFQIHDELLIEVPDDKIAQVAEIVQSIMESSEGLCGGRAQLRAPLKVSVAVGKSWGHMDAYQGSPALSCMDSRRKPQLPTEAGCGQGLE